MEEHAIKYTQTYQQFKTELDYELNKAANSFVRIGYLLKQARDTDILKDSPYSNHVEFAKAEYRLDESQVSRFIGISERFSKEDNPEELKDEFREYGVAKLDIMLTLPDKVNEELSPDMSKAEIAAVAEAVHEEEKITPIERMTEETSERSYLEEILYQIGKDNAAMMAKAFQLINFEINPNYRKLPEIFAPAGQMLYVVRVPGKGRVMFNVKGDTFTATNPLTGDKDSFSADGVGKAIEAFTDREYYDKPETVQEEIDDGKKLWECIYGLEFPENAPVQKKEQKVSVAETKKPKNDKKAAKNVKKPEKATEKPEKVTEKAESGKHEDEAEERLAAAGEGVEERLADGTERFRYSGVLMPSQALEVMVEEYERRRSGEGTAIKMTVSENGYEAMKEAIKMLKEAGR